MRNHARIVGFFSCVACISDHTFPLSSAAAHSHNGGTGLMMAGGTGIAGDLDYESSSCDCNSCCGTTSSKRKFNCHNNKQQQQLTRAGKGKPGGNWCRKIWCCLCWAPDHSNQLRELEDENYSEICSNNRSVR